MDRDDLIEDAYVKNHVLNFIVNDTLFKKVSYTVVFTIVNLYVHNLI